MWENFKTNPPYDAKSDEEAGLETDRVHAWFIYKYKNRNHGMTFLSFRACEFYDGVFTEYTSHMRTSHYPYDHIEVLYWCDAEEVRSLLNTNFKESGLNV